jgi:hypothetical protein
VAKRLEGIKVECIGSSSPQCTVVPEEEEDGEEEKRYSSPPSSPWHYMEVSDQHHILANLTPPPRKEF